MLEETYRWSCPESEFVLHPVLAVEGPQEGGSYHRLSAVDPEAFE